MMKKTIISENVIYDWTNYLSNRDYSDNTIQNYVTDFRLFMKYLKLKTKGSTVCVDEITLAEIESRTTYLSGVKTPRNSIYYHTRPTISPSTIQGKLTAIKSFLKFRNNIHNDGIEYSRIEQRKIKAPKVTVLNDTEYQTLFYGIENIEKYKLNALRSQLIVNIGYTSGLRLSEILNLKVKDIQNGKAMITGKGNKDRRAFFTDSTLGILDNYLTERTKPIPWTGLYESDSDYAIISHNSGYDFGNKISKNTVCSLIKNYSTKLNIGKRITCHCLRHSYATKLLNGGMNIREIQELLGHSDIQTTERYCHVLSSELENKVKSLFS